MWRQWSIILVGHYDSRVCEHDSVLLNEPLFIRTRSRADTTMVEQSIPKSFNFSPLVYCHPRVRMRDLQSCDT
jgi:hypothetical protein